MDTLSLLPDLISKSIRKFSVQTRLTKSELATITDRWSIEIGFENVDIMQT